MAISMSMKLALLLLAILPRQRLTLLQLQVNCETFTSLPCQALCLEQRSLIGHGHIVFTDVVQNHHLL